MEIELSFTDITIAETNGDYQKTKEIMDKDSFLSNKWVVKTDVNIIGPHGVGMVVIDMYSNGDIYVVDYDPSIGDVFYNPDIIALTEWAVNCGWKRPQPIERLIKESKDFWKHFYDTGVIDSKYFDSIHGKREYIDDDIEGGV